MNALYIPLISAEAPKNLDLAPKVKALRKKQKGAK